MENELYKNLGFTKFLYHYTSIDAICGGLITKEGLLFRLTHCAYLNDKREFNIGQDLFIKRLKGSQKEYIQYIANKPHYILAFSQQADFLPMWSMYGKNGSGVMLSLDTNIIFNSFGTILTECMYCNEELEFTNSEHEEYLKGVIESYNRIKSSGKYDDVAKFHIHTKLNEMIPLIKSDYFSYEKEVRLVIKGESNHKPSYRTDNNIIIPYITKILPKESLKNIMIGPTLDANQTKQSLEMFLGDIGYDNVKIEISKAPYRR